MFLALLWVELIPQVANSKTKPQSLCMSHSAGASPKVELFPAGSGACQDPLGVWLVGLSSGVVRCPPLVVLVWGPLRWYSGTGCQTLCVTSLGLHVWSYHTIHFLWLHLLGLSVHGRGQARGRSITGLSSIRPASLCQLYCLLLRLLGLPQSFRRKTVEWAPTGHDPQTLLQGMSSQDRVTRVKRMGLVGLLLGVHAVRYSMSGKWPPTLEPYHSVSNSSSPWRRALQV